MKRKTLYLLIVFFVLAGLILSKDLMAAPYYEGKRITIISGSEAGGGYDRMSRLLAKHLPKHTPGNPTIIVENMPGAGTIIATNYIYNIAKPDGLTILGPQRGIPIAQMLKAEGVKFDLPYLAPPGTPNDIVNILRDAFAKVVEDPELKEESKKLMMAVNYVPPDECLKVINYILNQPEDVIRECSKYIKF